LRNQLSSGVAPWVLALLLVSIFACGLASMAATTRLIFALARDNMLPLSGWLKQVHPTHRVPRSAILLTWFVSSAVVVLLDNFGQLHLVTSISAVAGYLGYSGIIAATLMGTAGAPLPGMFSLGAARLPIAVAAVCWTLGLVVALVFPFSGDFDGYIPAICTTTAVGLGVVIYVAIVRARINRGEAGPPVMAKGDRREQ